MDQKWSEEKISTIDFLLIKNGVTQKSNGIIVLENKYNQKYQWVQRLSKLYPRSGNILNRP